MQIDKSTVSKVAHLARLRFNEEQTKELQMKLKHILTWVEQLVEVNAQDVNPMMSVNLNKMPERDDVVTDGDKARSITDNAPITNHNMFVVPKVVE
jgi:aspartyl-tRNA(Asn)/glutamyl-tRNA(Gln) amidotransferase subunit C